MIKERGRDTEFGQWFHCNVPGKAGLGSSSLSAAGSKESGPIDQKEDAVEVQAAQESGARPSSASAQETCTPPRASSKVKKDARPSPADVKTSPPAKKLKLDKEAKKNIPDGFGGVTIRASTCVICERPRTYDQNGRACATCQKKMRERNTRSLTAVLAKPTLTAEIRALSLEAKPLQEPKEVADEDFHKAVEDLKKLLKKVCR